MTPPGRPVGRALVAAAALVVTGGLAALAPPAMAISGPLFYTCDLQGLGTATYGAVIDTDAPATMSPGQSVPLNVTSTVTVPADVTDFLYSAGIRSVDGTSTGTGKVDGVARSASLTIPRTTLPTTAGSTMSLVGTGTAGVLTAGADGSTIAIAADNFTVQITAYDGSNVSEGTVPLACTLQSGQATGVDSVAVKAPATATTTTITLPSASVAFGAATPVTADVAQVGTNAKPEGTVAFTFEGKTVSADVKGGKAKADLPAALTMGVRPVTAIFTPSTTSVASSNASTTLTVVRDSTSTVSTAVYRAAKGRIVGKAAVTADHGTAVTGFAKLILKRDGVKIRTAKVAVNTFGMAKKVFKNISKAGQYAVVARYLGSGTLARSKGTDKIVV